MYEDQQYGIVEKEGCWAALLSSVVRVRRCLSLIRF